MKRAANIAVMTGLVLMILGFILPWYQWNVELVGQTVALPLLAGGTEIGGWQLIAPRSLVRDVPTTELQYGVLQGVSTDELLKSIGVNWLLVPALVPIAFVIVIVLVLVSQGMGHSRLRDGMGLFVTGGILTLALLIWNPGSPAPLERLALQPAIGKYVTLLGGLLVTASGLLNAFVKRPEQSPVTAPIPASPMPQSRTCLKCLQSVPRNMEVCPQCGQKMT